MVRRWWLTMVVMDDGNMHQVDRHAAAGINAFALKEVNWMPDSATGKLDQQHNMSVLEWQSLLLVGIVRLLWTGSPLQMEPAVRYHIQYSWKLPQPLQSLLIHVFCLEIIVAIGRAIATYAGLFYIALQKSSKGRPQQAAPRLR